MLQEYKDILARMGNDPTIREEIETYLNEAIPYFNLEYHIDILEMGHARIEFYSESRFSATKYMETSLLYYCIYGFFDLLQEGDPDVLEYTHRYGRDFAKALSDGINKFQEVVTTSEDI